MNYHCPHCQLLLSDDGLLAGQLAYCPSCRGQFYVPADSSVTQCELVDVQSEPRLYYVTISDHGQISVNYRNAGEAKSALKELGLLRKHLALEKRRLKERQRATRAQYTDDVRRRAPKFIGGGQVGQFIRAAQTISRASARYELANVLAPLEKKAQEIEAAQHALESVTLQVKAYIVQFG